MENHAAQASHFAVEAILETLVIAVVLGILAQVFAQRFKLPAILPLLIVGMGAGPFGLGLFDPASLGHALEVYVHLGVALILFEGGLSLDLKQLRQVGGSLRNLLGIGALVTMIGGAVLAHKLLGISWGTSLLFGAIVTVTGPTVIVPLLRHMTVPRQVRTTLLSEGLMIDPIGAVLAYYVLQWIERDDLGARELLVSLLELSAIGGVLGFAAGGLTVLVLRDRHMAEELRNLVILAILMAAFAASERQAPQSGVLAAVVMGITVSAAPLPDVNPLKAFKGQLTVLLISILFVLLSAQLDLEAMMNLGVNGLLVVAGLILIVRPLSVLVSVSPRELDWKGRTLLALTAPRGIVAAAVASVCAIQLRATGAHEDAAILEGLVYLVILVTCAWATLMAPLMPRWLGWLGDPSRRKMILVGAHPLAKSLARAVQAAGWHPVMVDSAVRKLASARADGVSTVCGDARHTGTYEEAGIERDTYVMAITANDELNLFIANRVREEFGIEHPVVLLQQPPREIGETHHAWIDILGGGSLTMSDWIPKLQDGSARIEEVELDDERQARSSFRSLLREHPESVRVLCGWTANHARPIFQVDLKRLSEMKYLTVLVRDKVLDRLDEISEHREAVSAEFSGKISAPDVSELKAEGEEEETEKEFFDPRPLKKQ